MTGRASLRPTLLDRYVAREVLPPTGVGLLLFTFILVLDQISQLTRILVSRGAELSTVFKAFVFLLPSIFSVTIPMAFLLGVLLAFGRMAADSEIVALRASGVSPARLLRPVCSLAALATAVTFCVVAILLPAANQAYRELIFALVVSKAKTGVQPRVFNDDLVPGMVIYVSDIPAETGEWKDIFIHDGRDPRKPGVILARRGRLDIDRARRSVSLQLAEGVLHTHQTADPAQYDGLAFASRTVPFPFEQFYPNAPIGKGDREMTIPELRKQVADLRALGKGRAETGRFEVEIHKKFAIAFACVVFGLLGLGLSLGSKKEARSAAFGLSIGVIFVYYILIRLGEQAGDTGMLSPVLAMWGANLVLGTAALVLLVLNHREAAFDPLDPTHYKALLPRIRRHGHQQPAPRAVAGARQRPRRVLLLRVPRWSVPVPGLLDRYVARVYVGQFFLLVVAFWSLFVLISFAEIIDDIRQNRVKGAVVFHYYAFSTPQTLHLIAPVVALVAVLITYGVMSRRNEITAMKAAGVSVYRASLPALALGCAVSLAMFSGAEYVLPPMNKAASQDWNVIKGRPARTNSLLEHRWVLGSDSRLYHYDYLEERPKGAIALYGVTVYDLDQAGWELRDQLYASLATWNGVAYDLERGWRRSFGSGARFYDFTQRRTREIEPPSHFSHEERAADTLRFAELQQHIGRLEGLGLDVQTLRVQLHRKLAFPLVSLVMTVLGIPFAFVVARKGALFGIAASIVIAIVYWACLAVFDALGNNAYLPPIVAAWAPNFLFGAAGLYLMFTLET